MELLPYGDRALLVELDDAAAVSGYAAALFASTPAGVVDIVPAARTVLVVCDPRTLALDELARILRAVVPVEQSDPSAPVVTVDVRYDGEDLLAVAEHCGLEPNEVVRRHSAVRYRSAFCGFAPGFAYLTGLDPSLVVPRLATPRPRVRSGSVAIAAEYCGVYPGDMPGGWRILGHSDVVLWDITRPAPALLVPGTVVRFRPVPRREPR
jgi:5-oxoprolinase (ATP-hydrolysing) subunit B